MLKFKIAYGYMVGRQTDVSRARTVARYRRSRGGVGTGEPSNGKNWSFAPRVTFSP